MPRRKNAQGEFVSTRSSQSSRSQKGMSRVSKSRKGVSPRGGRSKRSSSQGRGR